MSPKKTLKSTKILHKTQHLPPLDLCLEKAIISKEMHQAANLFIHFYIVRYGNRRLIADYGHSLQRKIYIEDTNEEAVKNLLYKNVATKLINTHSYKIVRDTCVFSITPSFLKCANKSKILSETALNDYKLFLKGMKILSKFLLPVMARQSA